MSEALWSRVDEYFHTALNRADPALEQALADSDAAGLPAIAVSPNQGKLLGLLVSLTDARKVLEIGTLGGYSAICMARALPPAGKLVTLEYDPKHAAVAQRNIARAGLADRVEIRIGPAIETLPKLTGEAPFDLFFIDADKESNADYVEWSLKLARPGSLIIVDNVVRNGKVIETDGKNAQVVGVRRMIDLIEREPRLEATAIQTVGAKGYDGLLFAKVKD